MASEWESTGDCGGFGSNQNGFASAASRSNYQPRQRTEWACTSCDAKNFGNRTECFKCSEPKGDAVDVPSTGGFKRASDWICTACEITNFGSRNECYKCNEPKGDAKDAPADSQAGARPPRARTEWYCTVSTCNAKNFGNRTECFKCNEPKGDAEDVPSDPSGGPKKASDWICTACSVKNFGSRYQCFKCSEPKGDAQDAPADDSAGGAPPRVKTEWYCTVSECKARNFSSRTECFKCNEPKGDAEDVPSDPSGGPKKASDWICTACSGKNFGSRNQCFKCEEPKGDAKDAPDSGSPGDNVDDKPKESYIPQEANDEEIFSMRISTGINFSKLYDIPVMTVGDNVPPPCTSFADAGLRKFVLDNIEKGGYENPTPVQKHAIPIILGGRDIMACAQTGSGKTAAFLVPIINTLLTDEREMTPGSPHVIIVSPTRELVTQIYNEARKFAAGSIIKCCQIYGGTVSRHQSAILGHGCHILVATPGRLIDFVDRSYIDFKSIRFAVLDEADRMLDMGFQEAVEKVMKHPTMVPTGERQTLMFSVMFPENIKDLAKEFLHEYIFLTIGIVGGACQDVDQNLYEVARTDKREKLTELLNAEDPTGTIVFVATQRTADFLATFLSESKHSSTSIHGNRLQSQREEALRDFKTNKMKILIATSVAARGLDIPNVSHVINYDMPKEIDDYVHRIGRTGRVGNKGKASSFYDPEQDSAIVSDLVKVLTEANQTIPDFLSGGGGGGAAQNGGGDDDEW